MFLLDTNICIYAMKNSFPSLTDKLFSIHPDEIVVSSITVSELEYGASKSRWKEETRFRMRLFLSAFQTIPFSQEDALVCGRIRALLASAGTPIGPYDLMIAAQALQRNLTVVTHNTKEFERVPGLLLEDWVMN